MATAALITCFAIAACAANDKRVVLKALNAQLAEQYHQCGPVGWDPVPVLAGVFYPGYSAEYIPEIKWLPAQWIGTVRTKYLAEPEIRASFDVMNELVRAKMLERNAVPGGFRYNLTESALDYYWEHDRYRDNSGGQPYLCYSRIIPERVLWAQPLHVEKDSDGHPIQVFRAKFTWRPSPDADWANSAALRSHSVVLPPIESPAIAKFVNVDGDWMIQNVYAPTPALPRVADASVWPPLRR